MTRVIIDNANELTAHWPPESIYIDELCLTLMTRSVIKSFIFVKNLRQICVLAAEVTPAGLRYSSRSQGFRRTHHSSVFKCIGTFVLRLSTVPSSV